MKPSAAAFFPWVLSLFLMSGAAAPVLAHSLDEVQADLLEREHHVAFEPNVGSPFPAFRLQDPDGHTVDLASLRGKVVVLDFISTRCTDGCPAQSNLMAQVQADVAAGRMGDQVRLISVSLDPEQDTAAARKAYGPAHGLKPATWTFLAGQSGEDARRLAAAAGLKLDRQADGTYTHPIVTYVVDSAGMLRARFLGLDYDPLNMIVYVNALTNDHHEFEHGETPAAPASPSLWQTLKRYL